MWVFLVTGPSFGQLPLLQVGEGPEVVSHPSPVLEDIWGRPFWMAKFSSICWPLDSVDLH